MSVIKSNFTTRISNHIQKAIREESARTGKSVNQVSEEVYIAGLRTLSIVKVDS
jgi:predicted HicB family RNase H-like nuclease